MFKVNNNQLTILLIVGVTSTQLLTRTTSCIGTWMKVLHKVTRPGQRVTRYQDKSIKINQVENQRKAPSKTIIITHPQFKMAIKIN